MCDLSCGKKSKSSVESNYKFLNTCLVEGTNVSAAFLLEYSQFQHVIKSNKFDFKYFLLHSNLK